jgi:DNA polymerase I-like protein with 3'-5' exonuclease and polymerase domains
MEQINITTEYDLIFSAGTVKKLLPTTRVILLRYYTETAIVAVLEDMEKQGIDIKKLGFLEALDEFERRAVPRIAKFAGWLTVKKKCSNC